MRGGGGARGARGGGDNAGVCPRGGIGLIPFGGAILQPQRCHSRSGKPLEGLFTSYVINPVKTYHYNFKAPV